MSISAVPKRSMALERRHGRCEFRGERRSVITEKGRASLLRDALPLDRWIVSALLKQLRRDAHRDLARVV